MGPNRKRVFRRVRVSSVFFSPTLPRRSFPQTSKYVVLVNNFGFVITTETRGNGFGNKEVFFFVFCFYSSRRRRYDIGIDGDDNHTFHYERLRPKQVRWNTSFVRVSSTARKNHKIIYYHADNSKDVLNNVRRVTQIARKRQSP